MTTAPTRVLFAVADTGGGPRSAALAMSAALQQVGGDAVTSTILDMLQITNVPIVRSASTLYKHLTTDWLSLHDRAYQLTDHPWLVNAVSHLFYVLAKRNIIRTLQAVQPHLVVGTHPLTYRFLGAARREHRLPFRFVTVVTDLVSVHAAWIYPDVDLCLLPTDESYTLLQRRGMPTHLLRRIEFPVHPKFVQYARSQSEARSDLAIDQQRFTVLVTSGGVGAGHVQALVQTLEQHLEHAQLLVVTGNNQALAQELSCQRRSPHTHIYGFVQNMEALMAASDVVVTKAGPGTLMEALVMRRPVIVTEAVGVQEWGNIDFVQQHQLGFFCPTVQQVLDVTRQLRQPQYYTTVVERLSHAAPRHGAMQIAHILLDQFARHYRPPTANTPRIQPSWR